jgi:2-phospho-L-lactate guanylyltransferase
MDRDRVWAIVPIKRLASSKQRLDSALGQNRVAFARLVLARTLATLVRSKCFANVLVVTPDIKAAAIAKAAQAHVVEEAGDLNAAVAAGVAAARCEGADVCMIVHADLPLLTEQGVCSIVEAYLAQRGIRGQDIIGLVRCKDGTGTNVALLDPQYSFTSSFGPDSFEVFTQVHTGRTHELCSHEAAFDVDTPRDIEALRAKLQSAEFGDASAQLLSVMKYSSEQTSKASGDPVALLATPSPMLKAKAAA